MVTGQQGRHETQLGAYNFMTSISLRLLGEAIAIQPHDRRITQEGEDSKLARWRHPMNTAVTTAVYQL